MIVIEFIGFKLERFVLAEFYSRSGSHRSNWLLSFLDRFFFPASLSVSLCLSLSVFLSLFVALCRLPFSTVPPSIDGLGNWFLLRLVFFTQRAPSVGTIQTDCKLEASRFFFLSRSFSLPVCLSVWLSVCLSPSWVEIVSATADFRRRTCVERNKTHIIATSCRVWIQLSVIDWEYRARLRRDDMKTHH